MARLIETDLGNMFTVDMGVGPGRANNRDDVLVVQYLLNLWLQHPESARVRALAGPQASRRLAVDGIIGPKTKACIELFQGAITALDDAPIICDGCIDKPRGDMTVPGLHQTTYTIFELNNYVCSLYFDHYYISEVYNRTDLPPRLRTIVKRDAAAWLLWVGGRQ